MLLKTVRRVCVVEALPLTVRTVHQTFKTPSTTVNTVRNVRAVTLPMIAQAVPPAVQWYIAVKFPLLLLCGNFTMACTCNAYYSVQTQDRRGASSCFVRGGGRGSGAPMRGFGMRSDCNAGSALGQSRLSTLSWLLVLTLQSCTMTLTRLTHYFH